MGSLRDGPALPQAGVEPGVERVSAPPEAGRVREPKKGRKPGLRSRAEIEFQFGRRV
jgi:hypothetical protein